MRKKQFPVMLLVVATVILSAIVFINMMGSKSLVNNPADPHEHNEAPTASEQADAKTAMADSLKKSTSEAEMRERATPALPGEPQAKTMNSAKKVAAPGTADHKVKMDPNAVSSGWYTEEGEISKD